MRRGDRVLWRTPEMFLLMSVHTHCPLCCRSTEIRRVTSESKFLHNRLRRPTLKKPCHLCSKYQDLISLFTLLFLKVPDEPSRWMPKIMNTDKTNKRPFELYAQKHWHNVSNIMSESSNYYFKMEKCIKITVSQQTHSALLHKTF